MLGTSAISNMVRVSVSGTKNVAGTMRAVLTLEFSSKDA
jgi:hypothetical protein